MSFGKACIAPLQGCIAEVLDEAGAFLYDSNNKDSLLEGINRAIETKDKLAEMGRYNLTLAKKWNWNYISELTLNLYMSCFKSAK
jgi:glycosyltransferase involved in cell wall biosynthesis